MPIKEPETVAEMEQLQKQQVTAELLQAQRSEHGHREALVNNLLYQGRHKEARKIAVHAEHLKRVDAHEKAIKNPDDK